MFSISQYTIFQEYRMISYEKTGDGIIGEPLTSWTGTRATSCLCFIFFKFVQ